ncbi:hypothetical protein ACIPSJ_27285 [Streptomyces sp. NPDC090088]|uniref:hypothetical protein n=1 Tax=Streptomyces sp. NPDC090088 TaxID=3365944 RepID=UPI003824EE7D
MDITTSLGPIRDNFLGERRLLVDAIAGAWREGTSAKEIARTVAPAFGRDQVLQFLAAVALHDSARKALAEAGLDGVTEVTVTGVDAPREARLCISADPSEVTDFDSLPQRIRAALHDFQITLAPTRDSDDPAASPDDLILDGQAVRLVRTEPRS